MDEVGLDVAAKVAGVLSKAFPDRMQPAPALEKLVAAGRLGKKSGSGFYRHARPQAQARSARCAALLGLHARAAPDDGPDVLSERMVLAMINEAARCVEEGIVADAGQVDLAMIFGAGFPPFRGGVLRYADALGPAEALVDRLRSLRAEKGRALRAVRAAGGERRGGEELHGGGGEVGARTDFLC